MYATLRAQGLGGEREVVDKGTHRWLTIELSHPQNRRLLMESVKVFCVNNTCDLERPQPVQH